MAKQPLELFDSVDWFLFKDKLLWLIVTLKSAEKQLYGFLEDIKMKYFLEYHFQLHLFVNTRN